MEKIYVFDFDGTLGDSAVHIAKLTYELLDSRNIKYPPDILKHTMPLGWVGYAKYIRNLGVEESVEEIVEGIERMLFELYSNKIPLKDGAVEYIKKLRAEGSSCNILTGSPHSLVVPCLKLNGADGLFDNIWSVSDHNIPKTDIRLYDATVGTLGVPYSEIKFFDDNCQVLRAAQSFGFKVYGVYDPTTAEYEDEIRGFADGYVKSFRDLL